MNANEYYSHYGYGAPHPTSNVYADPNGLSLSLSHGAPRRSVLRLCLVYGGGNVYDYNSYYTSGGAGASGAMADSGTGQQGSNSPNEKSNYERDAPYGKAKTSIIPSPTYHQYPIS